MGNYIPTIPEWFDVRKAAQVAAFFALKAGGKINVLRATKMIYLADRLSMERREHPITNDNFVSMPKGPVNTYTYSFMKGVAPVRTEVWAEYIGPETPGKSLPLASSIQVKDLDELSRGDLAILEETWEKYKDVDRFSLADFTHDFCPEWTDPQGSSLPLSHAKVYKRLNKDDPLELEEQLQAERQLALMMGRR